MHVTRPLSPQDEFMAYHSGSGSGDITLHSIESEHDPLNNDVFGASPIDDSSLHTPDSLRHIEPSDVPRLRASQNTAGYREGTTAAKASVAQGGFDEGYPLGAAIGIKAGLLLGVVEGLAATFKKDTTKGGDGSNLAKAGGRLEKLLTQARQDLAPQVVFHPDYWGGDGNWKYDVPGSEEQIVFADVARHHPMILKWDLLVKAEEERWGISRTAFRNREALEELPAQEFATRETRNEAEPKDLLQW